MASGREDEDDGRRARSRDTSATGDAPAPTAAEAIAVGLPWSGTLPGDGALRLCYIAAAAAATGGIEVVADGGVRAVHFRRGVVDHAGVDGGGAELGAFLTGRGVVSADALKAAERVRDRHAGDLVSALASVGAMDPAQTFELLQEHGIAVLAQVLASRRGAIRWDPGAGAPPWAFPLGSRWGVLCEAVRRLDGVTVRALLGDRAERVARRSGGRVDLDQLRLTALEARAATLFDGASSPAQLFAAHRVDGETLLRTALLLAETELLSFGVKVPGPPIGEPARPGPRRAPAAPAEPSPVTRPVVPAAGACAAAGAARTAAGRGQPPRPAAAPIAPAGRGAPERPRTDATSLQALHEGLAGADHFQVLGVKRDATTTQIKLAYFQLAKSYHPDAGPVTDPPEVKKLRADVFARLGEAWRVLGDEARRAQYVQDLAAGARVDASAIFKAEEAFRRATILVKARQYPAALQALDEAAVLNPDESEFSVWAAWVRFLVAVDRRAQHGASAAAIEAAVKKVPRCMPAYLFLALMAKLVGDPATAERHLRRGLELDPADAELTLELKHLRR